VTAVDGPTRLALAAQRGDAQALEALVEATYDSVWRLGAALVDAQSGDDLAQDAYLRVVRSLPSFTGRSSARTWILGITRHTALDELRARHRRRHRDQALSALGAGQRQGNEIGQEAEIAELLGELELDRRTAFVLTQVIDLSYEEAARVCGCPVGTIRSRVARARSDLIALLHPSASTGRVSHGGPSPA
jgi:RNA polymerase sigma-70 factor, ECF subfamily